MTGVQTCALPILLNIFTDTIKKMSSDVKVSNEEIQKIIAEEIVKRDVLDDDRAAEAKKKVAKALKPAAKPVVKDSATTATEE